jgi:hypothetical protein
MNPFLERGWSDTHTRLIGYICDTLAGCRLPGGLRARAEEFLMVEEPPEDGGTARADVAVVEPWKHGQRPSWPGGEPMAASVALAEPEFVLRPSAIERWVEIRTADGRLVTVIEVLSPSNKCGLGRDRYLRKRDTYHHAGVNVVEIDLLRGGEPTVAAESGKPGDATRYTICVFRAAHPDGFEVYHWGLRDRIPAFAVPLRATDPDAPLDLQPLVNRAYELGYYWQDRPSVSGLQPQLFEAEVEFAAARLREAGLIDAAS